MRLKLSWLMQTLLLCTCSLSIGTNAADQPSSEETGQSLFTKAMDFLQAGNRADALACFRQAGSNGLARAQATLAELLLGSPDEASRSEALRWAMLAARQGDKNMQKRLAIELREKDPAEYFLECWPWLSGFAEQGEPGLKFRAGIWAFNGYGGQKRMDLAFSYFSSANQSESFRHQMPQCSFLLGYLLENGFGTRQNYSAAAELYWQAAEFGWPEAVYRLGLLVEHGQGMSTDRPAARLLYLRAAELGIAGAAYRLGLLAYGSGYDSGVRNEALGWFLQAATNGLSVAQAKVGLSYQQDWLNRGPEPVEAVAWYRLAANSGNNKGARIRGENLEAQFSHAQQEELQARIAEVKSKVRTTVGRPRSGENMLPESITAKRDELVRPSETNSPRRPRRLAEARLITDSAANTSPKTDRNDLEAGLLKIYLNDLQSQVRLLVADRLTDLAKKGVRGHSASLPSPQEFEIILSFRLLSDGRVEDVDIVESNLDDSTASLFIGALEDSSPLVRWTPRLRAELSEEYQDLLLAFGRKSVLKISQ